MAYRATKKARKLWSDRANAKRERLRLENTDPRPIFEDDHITIEIKRKLTGEHALFELFPGDRSDNYSVYCNGKHKGIMGITRVTEGIRKALPRRLSELRLYG